MKARVAAGRAKRWSGSRVYLDSNSSAGRKGWQGLHCWANLSARRSPAQAAPSRQLLSLLASSKQQLGRMWTRLELFAGGSTVGAPALSGQHSGAARGQALLPWCLLDMSSFLLSSAGGLSAVFPDARRRSLSTGEEQLLGALQIKEDLLPRK